MCTHHANLSVTPGLLRYPLDYREPVADFFGAVHVSHQAFGIPRTAHVDSNAGVAVAGENRMISLIAQPDHIPFSVRDIFDNCGCRALFFFFR